MNQINFNSEEIKALQDKYPEAWYFMNCLRLEREKKELQSRIPTVEPS